MRPLHMFGLILWRGGLLVAGVAVLFAGARKAVQLIEVPIQLGIGYGLFAAGVLTVIVSLVLERIQDARAEGDLSE